MYYKDVTLHEIKQLGCFGTRKYPISGFRIFPGEREKIEVKIFISGRKKKD